MFACRCRLSLSRGVNLPLNSTLRVVEHYFNFLYSTYVRTYTKVKRVFSNLDLRSPHDFFSVPLKDETNDPH